LSSLYGQPSNSGCSTRQSLDESIGCERGGGLTQVATQLLPHAMCGVPRAACCHAIDGRVGKGDDGAHDLVEALW
jgi:hypothetical protein